MCSIYPHIYNDYNEIELNIKYKYIAIPWRHTIWSILPWPCGAHYVSDIHADKNQQRKKTCKNTRFAMLPIYQTRVFLHSKIFTPKKGNIRHTINMINVNISICIIKIGYKVSLADLFIQQMTHLYQKISVIYFICQISEGI